MEAEPFDIKDGDNVIDQPSEVRAERGRVIATGLGSTRLAFTPAAAFETAQRLEEAALQAEGRRTWRPE